MQYALMEVQGKSYLVDANEMQAVEFHGPENIADSPKPDEQASALILCYGAYLPQPGVTYEKALFDLLGAKGTWLGTIAESICHLIAVQDVRALGIVKVAGQTRIPFAILIQAHPAITDKIKGDDALAITGFVRYGNMSPSDNLLNRQGVFALQAVERGGAGNLTLESWGKAIDRNRAQRISRKIR
jgi:hypothetical protein